MAEYFDVDGTEDIVGVTLLNYNKKFHLCFLFNLRAADILAMYRYTHSIVICVKMKTAPNCFYFVAVFCQSVLCEMHYATLVCLGAMCFHLWPEIAWFLRSVVLLPSSDSVAEKSSSPHSCNSGSIRTCSRTDD